VEHIQHGTIRSAENIIDQNPIMKVAYDSTMNRYYFIAHKDDASHLVKFSRALLPKLAQWLNCTLSNFSLDTNVARPHIPPPTAPTQTVHDLPPSEKLPDGLMSTLASIQQSLNEYGAELRAIREEMHDHTGRTLPTDVVSAVQSSITHATTQWRDKMDITHDRFTEDIHAFTDGLRSVCRELSDTKVTEDQTLTDLVDKYDNIASTMNDRILAYGNEIAMLRINIEALGNRVNWLVEDLGLKSTPAQGSRRLPPAAMEMVMEAAYDDYFQGKDMAHADKTSADTTQNLLEYNSDTSDNQHSHETAPSVQEHNVYQANGSAPTQAGRPGTPPLPLVSHAPPQLATTTSLPPSPVPNTTSTSELGSSRYDVFPGGAGPQTTQTSIDLSSDPPKQPPKHTTDTTCAECHSQTSTPYSCELCSKTICILCTKTDLDTASIRCTSCRECDIITQPDPTPQTATSASDTNTSSDSSLGSSYSDRATRTQTLRRKTTGTTTTISKSEKSQATTTTTATSTTTETQPIPPSIPGRPATRRSVQASIDTMLRPKRGLTTTKDDAPTRRQNTGDSKRFK